MSSFLLVKIRSSNPFERGIQYGRQAVREIRSGIEGYQRHFKKTVGMSWDSIREQSVNYIDFLQAHCPEELAEARGIAAGADTDIKDIMALNCRYEILKTKPIECTSAAILPIVSGTDKTYIAQNWDYRPWVMDNSVIISIDDGNGTKILGITEGGQLVRNGLNNHGIGLCANNLTSASDHGGIGIPVTFLRRKILNARGFKEAENIIFNAERAVSCNYMIASGKEGLAADYESTPAKVYRIDPIDGIVTHANHITAQKEVCTNKSIKFRDEYLRARISKHIGVIDVEILKECLKDHKRYPGAGDTYPEHDCIEAVCTHTPLGQFDPDEVWQTVASVVYDLRDGCAHICKGPPCSGEYVKYDLP